MRRGEWSEMWADPADGFSGFQLAFGAASGTQRAKVQSELASVALNQKENRPLLGMASFNPCFNRVGLGLLEFATSSSHWLGCAGGGFDRFVYPFEVEDGGRVFRPLNCPTAAQRGLVGNALWNAWTSRGVCRDVNPNTGKLGGFASYDALVLFESFLSASLTAFFTSFSKSSLARENSPRLRPMERASSGSFFAPNSRMMTRTIQNHSEPCGRPSARGRGMNISIS